MEKLWELGLAAIALFQLIAFSFGESRSRLARSLRGAPKRTLLL